MVIQVYAYVVTTTKLGAFGNHLDEVRDAR